VPVRENASTKGEDLSIAVVKRKEAGKSDRKCDAGSGFKRDVGHSTVDRASGEHRGPSGRYPVGNPGAEIGEPPVGLCGGEEDGTLDVQIGEAVVHAAAALRPSVSGELVGLGEGEEVRYAMVAEALDVTLLIRE